MLEQQNLYYAALPTAIQKRWKPHRSLKEFRKGQQLSADDLRHSIYFPITCVAVIYLRSGTGTTALLRFAGSSSCIGGTSILNSGTIELDGAICRSGYAFELPMKTLLKSSPMQSAPMSLKEISLVSVFEKAVQSTCCAQSHYASQRLARVLLEASDHFPDGDGMSLTQSELAEILKVRRETIAEQVGVWSRIGIVSTKRAAIKIEQRDRLRAISCDCFQVVEDWKSRGLELWKRIAWQVD